MTLADESRRTKERRSTGAPVLVPYMDDPYTWALQQAELLRDGGLDLIDVANLAASGHDLADKPS